MRPTAPECSGLSNHSLGVVAIPPVAFPCIWIVAAAHAPRRRSLRLDCSSLGPSTALLRIWFTGNAKQLRHNCSGLLSLA